MKILIIKYQREEIYYSIKELIGLSAVESDNIAYFKLVNYVGKDNLEGYDKYLSALNTMESKYLFELIICDDMAIY